MKPELDETSGQHTTGHEWNGIKELNTPMPKAFSIWLWLSIAVAVLLWLLYPAWPYVTHYTGGILGYSSRIAVTEQVEAGRAQRAETFAPFETMDVAELAEMPNLRETYEPAISVLFRDNCAACHGRDAVGQINFPNLTDDHWLWSGTPEEIEYTLQVGINSSHDDTRYAEMPAFGLNEMLEQPEIKDVIEYVLQISGQEHDAAKAQAGETVFVDNCESCHNEGGIGELENGAPSLIDGAWIYGGTRESLAETLKYGRAGVMPHWSDRLSASEIRQLTLYLLWAGQDGNGD
ncbi:cytochrome-c oxidase, cbb3-type subunit III [uncultured Roseobacter sp.]|uniref:cytochrome-c oxidase, cbb3-type subunit III n=1 Tax=uncultured Roseobacter sp. TaxID=114847 RepID=UPI00260C1FBD|nr:cytochrome-c oxidase, cbb3-type subunit III [uncultured Roseobacter sp.]